MQHKTSLLLILFLLGFWNQNVVSTNPIEHLVVIMLENRSFDHLLGYLSVLKGRSDINGLTGTESNPTDPSDPASSRITVSNDAPQSSDIDPPHSVAASSIQEFGYLDDTDGYDRSVPAPMNGFVLAAEEDHAGWGPDAMKCFDPSVLPVTTALVENFAIFDAWYSSVPGPTQVNRMYLHSATSHGEIYHSQERMVNGYPQKTIFNSLTDQNIPWKIYQDPITTTLLFNQMRYPRYLAHMKDYKYFKADVALGKLAKYTLIEPAFYTWGELHPATDQHPGHDMAQGERLIKEVYETIRDSPFWHSTAILITYDEHGGFYDHVAPPMEGVPNPDGLNSSSTGAMHFAFDRLGMRVPTILISSRVKKGLVVKAPAQGQWEHSSVPATIKKLFGLNSFLTKRDEWAATFDKLFDQTPRTDCPWRLPDTARPTSPAYRAGTPLNGLQEDLTTLAGGLNMWFPIAQSSVRALTTETDAYFFAKTQVSTYIARKTRGLNIN